MKRTLIACCALIALAAPHAARATTPAFASPYMINIGAQVPGPQWVTDSYQQHFDNARSAGVGAALVPVAWSDIERVPGQYDWSGLDGLVAAAHADAIDLVLQVQSTGEWSVVATPRRTNTVHPLPNPLTAAPLDIGAAVPFWKALVGRYQPGGSLATERHWTDGWGVRSYEVENEPDFQPWPTGGWETVSKDYALYLSRVRAAVGSSVSLVGPALSGNDSAGNPVDHTGLNWLASMLSTDRASMEWASDQLRSSFPATGPAIGGGSSLSVLSYHCDFANGATGALTLRAQAIRQVAARFSAASQPLWCSEGAPTAYDSSDDTKKYRYAWAEVQFAAELLSAGVSRFNYDLGIEGGDSGATWAKDPIRGASIALTTAFPSGGGVVPAVGHGYEGARWTSPATGLTSTVLWADNEPQGSGTIGTPATVQVPVATPSATVFDPFTWTSQRVAATNGAVTLNLTPADPSAPWIVVESR